mgnify:CR=1 FL=1
MQSPGFEGVGHTDVTLAAFSPHFAPLNRSAFGDGSMYPGPREGERLRSATCLGSHRTQGNWSGVSDCQVFVAEVGVVEDLLGRPGEGDFAGVENDGAIGQLQRCDRILLDDYGGDAHRFD